MRAKRQIAVSTALFDGYPMEQAIEEIARAGLHAIEPAFIEGYVAFDETVFSEANGRRLSGAFAAAGLTPTAASAHTDLGWDGAASSLQRRLHFAAALGAPVLITNAGPAGRRAAVLETIAAALPVCEDSGVILALENPGHGADDLIGTAAHGAALLRDIDSPLVCLNYDIGNAVTYNEGRVAPADDLRACIGSVAHLHLKDVARRADGWEFTALGDGVVDYRAIWHSVPPDVPATIELPLRLDRPLHGAPSRRPEPVSLAAIRTALGRSANFLRSLEDQHAAGGG